MMGVRIMGGQTLNFMADFIFYVEKSLDINATLYASRLSPMLYTVLWPLYSCTVVQGAQSCKVAGSVT